MQCNLGYALVHGVGVEKNTVEGVKYYQLAAEQGNAQAMFNLGVRNSFSP